MPKPSKNESKDHFINRCVPIVISEGHNPKQATAICFSIWEQHKKSK